MTQSSFATGSEPKEQPQRPPFTVEAPGNHPVPGETIPRRHPAAKNGLITRPSDDVHTVFDIVRRAARLHPHRNAVGWRRLVKIHKETKTVRRAVGEQVKEVEKEWQYFELSKFCFLTYKEYETLAYQLGSGLRKLGLTENSKLHMFAATR